MTDESITPNFYLSEFLASDAAERRGIDNTPDARVLETLRNILIPAMQQVRNLLAVPIVVSSGYRSPALNAAVGGSVSSDHVTGHACDFTAPAYGTPRVICERLMREMAVIKFDQLIHEGKWVHISFSARRRNEVLTAHFGPNGATYTRGLA